MQVFIHWNLCLNTTHRDDQWFLLHLKQLFIKSNDICAKFQQINVTIRYNLQCILYIFFLFNLQVVNLMQFMLSLTATWWLARMISQLCPLYKT